MVPADLPAGPLPERVVGDHTDSAGKKGVTRAGFHSAFQKIYIYTCLEVSQRMSDRVLLCKRANCCTEKGFGLSGPLKV